MADFLVSIITPVRNDVTYIDKCILNVLSQDYPNIEHVIVDGASTDGTLDIISAYSKRYPGRVRFISEPDNGGGDAWNKGLKMAKGEIFGTLGADDFLTPGAIRVVADFFSLNPKVFFVHGNCDYINERGNIILRHKVREFNFHEFVNTARHIASTSAFYKREVMERIGWLDSSGDDFDVMLRITKNFEVYSIDKILSQVTIRPGSVFNSPKNFQSKLKIRKQTFAVSRKYGGSIFTRIALRYYSIFIFDRLNLEKLYPVAEGIYVRVLRFLKRIWK